MNMTKNEILASLAIDVANARYKAYVLSEADKRLAQHLEARLSAVADVAYLGRIGALPRARYSSAKAARAFVSIKPPPIQVC